MFGKVLLDVGRLLGDRVVADGPRPLRHVVLLDSAGRSSSGASPHAPDTVLELACRGDEAERIERSLVEVDGVRIESRRELPSLRVWRLELDRAARPMQRLAVLLDDPAVLYCQKRPARRPDFGAEPQAERIRRSEAAEFLGREVLNRRPGSRLLERHHGSLVGLFVELSAALRDAACWRVVVGRFDRTADLIERLARHAR
jgi:hypothetical protein